MAQSLVQQVGFFDLPRELRDRIYFDVLRPDCSPSEVGRPEVDRPKDGFIGCTKVLSFSKAIYKESIEVLHAHENIVEVFGRKRQLFRNPFDFGKPGLFWSYKSGPWRCHIPSRFCELQIVRLRKLAVFIKFPCYSDVRKQSSIESMNAEILRLIRVIAQNTELRILRLVLQREPEGSWGTPPSTLTNAQREATYDDMRSTIRPLLDLATQMQIHMGAEECKYFTHFKHSHDRGCNLQYTYAEEYVEPLVAWIYAVTPLHLRQHFELSYYQDEVFIPFETDPHPPERCKIIEKLQVRSKGLFAGFRDRLEGYELVHECRTCLKVFGHKASLLRHLHDKPTHRRQFSPKGYNSVSKSASQKSWVKCWTCAASFDTLIQLHRHLDHYKHRRYGMIPRWKEDNKRYNARWKRITEDKWQSHY